MASCTPGSAVVEVDVAFDAAGADATVAAGDGSSVPAVVGSVGGADVQVVADADDPHRHERPQRAVSPVGGELELLGGADRGELVVGPGGGHQTLPTRTRDLTARRSSIAA